MVRVMVLGVPNVGKSTFINKVANRKTARAEDRPGVTRSKQWVPVDATLELLDTPGILWPKFDDPEVGKRLAFTGAVKDDVLDIEELACYLMDYLAAHYADTFSPSATKSTVEAGDTGYDLLERPGASAASSCAAHRWTPSAWPASCWTSSAAASWAASPLRRWRTAHGPSMIYEQPAPPGFPLSAAWMRPGAGPLMGPLYAAAVILPEQFDLPGLNDSKKLTEKKREALFPLIQQQALAWSVASVSAREIDDTDILSARMRGHAAGHRRPVPKPDLALIDGNRDRGRSAAILTPHRCIVGGDALSASIAAASVLAKVSRDRYVTDVLDKQYPQYRFAQHKGYGTSPALRDAGSVRPVPRAPPDLPEKKWCAEEGRQRTRGRSLEPREHGAKRWWPTTCEPKLPAGGPATAAASVRSTSSPGTAIPSALWRSRPAPIRKWVCPEYVTAGKQTRLRKDGPVLPVLARPGLSRPLRCGGGLRRHAGDPNRARIEYLEDAFQ